MTSDDLAPHYERVERMLGAQKIPYDRAPYSAIAKTTALREAAEKHGAAWSTMPVAITFGDRPGQVIGESDAPNLHRRARVSCQLCGECSFGCNYGSKNTLDHTYLSTALARGLEIRTLAEVREFAPRPDAEGYEVSYLDHSDPSIKAPARTLTARRLILAAGALNSPYLLLKNRKQLPRISARLGERFGGNGDLMAFGYSSKNKLDSSAGPAITSGIQGQGFNIQDTALPAFVGWIVESVNMAGWLKRFSVFTLRRALAKLTRRAKTNLSYELSRLMGDCGLSSGMYSLTCCGDDPNLGKLYISRREKLELEWDHKKSKDYYARTRAALKQFMAAAGAKMVDSIQVAPQAIGTVHPHGGCPMAYDADSGVVDPYGEVFGYPGLYVCDGSILPGPIGVNPALTIAAVADRCADRMVEQLSP
jgi:cholesterol oxidase